MLTRFVRVKIDPSVKKEKIDLVRTVYSNRIIIKSFFGEDRMKKYLVLFRPILFISLLYITALHPQTTPQPTAVGGIPSVTFDTLTNKYKFYQDDFLRYEYQVLPGTTSNGGSLNTLKAFYDDGINFFLPSNFGGIRAMLDGVEKYPWDPGVTFKRISNSLIGPNEVYIKWKMMWNGDYCYYTYRIKIMGRTLIIKVECISNNGVNKATGFELDRCENAQSPKAIAIPYLPMFHILLSNNTFTSFFTDWELSNCTKIYPLDGSSYPLNTTSIWYSQYLEYAPKTNGLRNKLVETLYLTTSPNLSDVLPNVPNPVSSYKQESANRIVWDYREPFARLIRSPWNHLQKLKNAGVNNLWVQIHDWQYYHGNQCWEIWELGNDDGLPCTTPANIVDEPGSEYGGDIVLNSVISLSNSYGYRIGLHQNYVDYYENANCGGDFDYNINDVALNVDGTLMNGFYNECTQIQSQVLKPSKSQAYTDYWSQDIQSRYNLSGCYLDVHSSGFPYVDMDSSVTNSGMFRETVKYYRGLYPILRQNHQGPVQGEGGMNILYQGYVDDIEARIVTPTFHPDSATYNIPLLLDFDLLKLRSKTMVHGVGWIPLWLGINKPKPNWNQVLSYIATELAYGHGAYLPEEWDTQETVDFVLHAQTEYNHVFAIQKYIVNATPVSIQYGYGNSSLQTASEYIKDHEFWADINNSDFMGKVKVTYDNGVIVYVNRHPTDTWLVSVGTSGKWFSYHAIPQPNRNDAQPTLYAGITSKNAYSLPPNNGWVVYNPNF